MSSIETLKQELIAQKEAIIKKGGTIITANENPSPSEITNGINSIETPNFENATATEADVREGKTFYAGSLFQKTGTLKEPYTEELIDKLFVYGKTYDTLEKVSFSFKKTDTYIRPYLFYDCPTYVEVTLPEDLEEIGTYAFYERDKFVFTNINQLKKLKIINSHALRKVKGINLSQLWPTLEEVYSYGMADTYYENLVLNLPALKTIQTYAFASSASKKSIDSINFSNVLATTYSGYSFTNLTVNSDLVLPATLRTLSGYCFYRSSFNNVTIPATVTSVGEYSFGGVSYDPTDAYRIQTFTFESEIPPTIGNSIISSLHTNNGTKIYVPDVALEAYKTNSKLSKYADIIYPISEKP